MFCVCGWYNVDRDIEDAGFFVMVHSAWERGVLL